MKNVKDKFFSNNPIQGTKTNAMVGFLLSLCAIAAAAVVLLVDKSLFLFPVMIWGLALWQTVKGLASNAPGLAKVAKIFLVIGVIAILGLAVLSMVTTFNLLFGK